jgi:ASPM-SPD-2-Hydin domain-containing protein/centrosomal CEP192-like protein
MRLPQSIIRPISVFSAHFSIILTIVLPVIGGILLLGLGSPNAFASAQLTRSPSILRFGNVDVGQTETLMVTVTNTGLTSVTLSGVSVSEPEFGTPNLSLPLVLAAAQSVDVSISFTPTKTGWTPATIKFTSNASNPSLTVQTGGTGVDSEAVTASPSTLSFGQVTLGGNASLPLVLTNARSSAVTISSLQITGSSFSISGTTFPLTLSGGQSLALTATYTPQSAGITGGSILLIGPGLCVPLTGTGTTSGVGQLSLAPASLNYGNVAVGTTDTLAITMTATGGSVTVSSAASSSSQFALTGTTLPVTIASGQSLSVHVGFTPKSSGSESGSLSFSSTASNSQAIATLAGVGTVTSYSVSLLWNSTPDVAGYNVYRGTSASGSYTKLNSALDANTAYTDSSVAAGNTYYYAATSVNEEGLESALSSPPVEVAIP